MEVNAPPLLPQGAHAGLCVHSVRLDEILSSPPNSTSSTSMGVCTFDDTRLGQNVDPIPNINIQTSTFTARPWSRAPPPRRCCLGPPSARRYLGSASDPKMGRRGLRYCSDYYAASNRRPSFALTV